MIGRAERRLPPKEPDEPVPEGLRRTPELVGAGAPIENVRKPPLGKPPGTGRGTPQPPLPDTPENVRNRQWGGMTGSGISQDKPGMPWHDAFLSLADAQYGEPSTALQRAHDVIKRSYTDTGQGNAMASFGYGLEHVGDLTHRMSEQAAWMTPEAKMGQSYVEAKVYNGYKLVTNPTDTYWLQKLPYDHPVAAAGREYAAAHAKLKVYNSMQWFARQAAIDLGNRAFNSAKWNLNMIRDAINDGTYAAKAREYDPNYGETHPPKPSF